MKAIQILTTLATMPLLLSFVTYWYGLTGYYPNTTSLLDGAISDIMNNVERVVNPDYGLYDIVGGLIGLGFGIFGFVLLKLPDLIATFIYETVNIIGLVALAPVLYPVIVLLVYLLYAYYAMVVLSWINPSFSMSRKV